MKTFLKIVFYTLLGLLVLTGIFIYIYIKSVEVSLSKYDSSVKAKWAELYDASTRRVDLVNSSFPIQNEKDTLCIALNKVLNENHSKRAIYSKSCDLQFVQMEYELDKKVVFMLDSSKMNFKNKEQLRNKILQSNDSLNRLIDIYNNSVGNFNEFKSMFPNFFVAKKHGYKSKKYFPIKYGIYNEDPIAKSKKLADWVMGKDTISK